MKDGQAFDLRAKNLTSMACSLQIFSTCPFRNVVPGQLVCVNQPFTPGLGTWTNMMNSVWAYGSNWPMGGEIDILEGANLAYTNIMSAHTAEGCMLDPADSNLFSGIRRNLDCGVGTNNVGCGFNPPKSDTSSYGDGFNAVGGGVYAMEWDSEYISIWHFPRGAIPADIEAKQPDPRNWGLPQSLFGGAKCDVDKYFSDMKLVLNIVSDKIVSFQ